MVKEIVIDLDHYYVGGEIPLRNVLGYIILFVETIGLCFIKPPLEMLLTFSNIFIWPLICIVIIIISVLLVDRYIMVFYGS